MHRRDRPRGHEGSTEMRLVAYANKRAEIWGSMKEWLRDGAIDADPELIADPAALNTAMCSATAATRFSWSGKRT